MGRPPGKRDYATAFGEALDRELRRASLKPADIARGAGVSPSYVSRTMTGNATPSPKWTSTVAGVLNLTPEGASALHRAAAIDAGYQIDDPTRRAKKEGGN